MHNINITHIKRQCSVLLGKYKASNSIQFNTRRFFKIPIFGTCVGFGDSLTYSGKPDHWNNKVVFETVGTNVRQLKKNRQDPDSRKFLKNLFSDPPLENIAQYWGWLSCSVGVDVTVLFYEAANWAQTVFSLSKGLRWSDWQRIFLQLQIMKLEIMKLIKKGKQSSANTFNRNYFVVSTYSFDSCTVPSMCFFKSFKVVV